jgi:hypothetical protein
MMPGGYHRATFSDITVKIKRVMWAFSKSEMLVEAAADLLHFEMLTCG